MTRLLISTAVAGILAFGGAAFAQGHDDHHGGPQAGHEQGHAPGPAPGGGHMDHAAPGGGGHMDRANRGPVVAPAAAPQRPTGHATMRGPDNRPNNAMRGPAANNAMRGPGPGNAMRGAAPGGHRDYSSYHRAFSAPHHFRAPTSYRRPSGWYAHRWTYGEILPRLFWAQDYWLNDFGDFGLMPPPPGTVWVRDGDDALLIDQYSGEIIQVEYGVFY